MTIQRVVVRTTHSIDKYEAPEDEVLGWHSSNANGDRVLRIWKNDELIAEYQPRYWERVSLEYVELSAE